ncbi:MAG TPA: SpoIIE family protein phosphatase [Candidatus Acidoferrales bacterium]|jgi:PAS domain S-box-containing protein|nr:SpoIIE family protein phosphatase [Candidatus Acidoferrales bacterium]
MDSALRDVAAFADALPQLLWIARPDGSVEFVNRAWCAFTGKPATELQGSGWLKLLSPKAAAAAERYWDEVRAGCEPAEFELRVTHASGGRRRVRGRNVPVRDASGEIAYWIGWCAGVEEMENDSDPFHTLADTLPALAFMAAAGDDRLVFVNRAWREYTGLGIGSTLAERQALVHPSEMTALVEALRDQAAELELRLRRAGEQTYRWHLMRWRRVAAPDGTPLYRVGTLIDIEERHAAQEEQAFLSRAGSAINASLDLEQTVRTVARHAVPMLADWCEVDLVEREGVVTRAFAHRNAAIQQRVNALVGRVHERSPSEAYERIAESVRAGKPMKARRVDVTMANAVVSDPAARELYRTAGFDSSIILPLAARGRVIGALVMVRTDPTRPHGDRDVRIAEEFARRASLAIDNALIFGREHRVAEAMQAASLPKRLPKLPTVEMHAIYVPGRADAAIGGDWYDAFRLRDGRLVVSIGDVSGSGVDAAVTMSNMRQIIRGTAQVHADPVLMLNAADRALRLEDTDLFVTAFVGVIDPIRRTIVYANAGHPPPYVRDPAGKLTKLEFEGLPLGLRNRSVARPGNFTVDEDSVLVFYTDGLIESTHNIVAGIGALESVLRLPGFAVASNPAKFVRANMLAGAARDDVAILTVKLLAAVREEPGADGTRRLFRWRYEKIDREISHELRQRLARTLDEHGFNHEAKERAELVLGELIGNIARHAPGALEVIVDLSSPSPVLHVIDEGPGFERAPMLPRDLLSESGRGLYIVSELTDEFSVSRGPSGGSHARAVLGP